MKTMDGVGLVILMLKKEDGDFVRTLQRIQKTIQEKIQLLKGTKTGDFVLNCAQT